MAAEIEIQVNGESRRVARGMSVEDLLASLDLQPKMIVVEHNGDILRKGSYAEVDVAEGDALELVHFVGGG